MSASLRAGNSSDGYLQIDGADIVSITASGMAPSSGKTITATNGPSNSAFSFRNKIINGGCQVAQRTAPTLSSTAQYGATDRFFGFCYAGTGVSGTLGNNTGFGSNTNYGCAVFFNAFSCTTGYVSVGQRIEAKNSVDLNGKTVTFKAKVYHNFGSAQTFRALIYKPVSGVADSWNALPYSDTLISIVVGSTSCSSGGWTTLTGSVTLGASDATNGLMILIDSATAVTVSSKDFATSDWQLEVGSTATPFESRPYGTELALCQRYYEYSYDAGSQIGTSYSSGFYCATGGSTNVATGFPFRVIKRIAPTVVLYGTQGGTNKVSGLTSGSDLGTTVTGTNITNSGVAYISDSGTGFTANGLYRFHWTASAEL